MKLGGKTIVAVAWVSFLAILLGCGGGGGGSTTGTTSTATTSTATTSTATTSTATTSTATTSTATTSTATTSTATTSTATTSTATTSTATTSTATTSGSLPTDAILYTINDGSIIFLKSIKEDGSNNTALAAFNAANIKAVAPNPTKTNQYAFASINQSNTTCKLYKGNSSLDPSTSTLLSSTTFADIDDVEFTPDGLYVIFKADAGTGYNLYRVPVGGGAAVALDSDFFEMSVSPVVGSHLVAYSKNLGTTSEVYTIDYLTGTQTPITNLGVDVYSPNWSRDGANLIFGFTPDPLTINAHLFNVVVSSGTVTQVTPASASNWEPFGFYNENMTKVAVDGINSGGIYLSSFNVGNSTYTPILTDTALGTTCYWTDTNGRAISVNLPHYQLGKRVRRHR